MEKVTTGTNEGNTTKPQPEAASQNVAGTPDVRKDENPNQAEKLQSPFADAIRQFVHDMDSLSDTSPVIVEALEQALDKQIKIIGSFLGKSGSKMSSDNGKPHQISVRLSREHAEELTEMVSGMKKHERAQSIVSRSFIVSIVSHFDAYVGRLIRALFFAQPNLLQLSEKNITFSQLLKFDDISQAREYVVEKEVESVLRESHSGQFAWLEGKLKMTLRKDLAVWPEFVEITERRNLFVHNDGVVSSQYLQVCDSAGVVFDERPKVGTRLSVNNGYFQRAYRALFEIGVKLGHVLWRKIVQKEIAHSQDELHKLTYDLLVAEKYDLAIRLLEFSLDVLRKHTSEEMMMLNLVNLCIAYAASGGKDKCNARLASVDWTAKSDKFRIAHAVLTGNEEGVFKLMRKIGRSEELESWTYRKWPLFRKLRENEKFMAVFQEIYGESLILPNTDQSQVIDQLVHEKALAAGDGCNPPNAKTT